MSLIQLLKFRTWKTRLFKMPHFEGPRFQTKMKITVASGLCHETVILAINFEKNFEEGQSIVLLSF